MKPSFVSAVDPYFSLCSATGIGQKLFRDSTETISSYVSHWHEQPRFYGAIKPVTQIA